MTRLKPDQRDATPDSKVILDPLAVLLSARAVSAAKEMKLPVWEVKRGDWVPV